MVTVMKFQLGVVLIAALGAPLASAGPYEQAKRIHDRLTGAPPSAEVLNAMAARTQVVVTTVGPLLTNW